MNEHELQRVTLEQAKKLKALGFDWKVYHWYNSDGSLSTSWDTHSRNQDGYSIAAPTVALALKWMRDVKGIDCGVAIGAGKRYFAAFSCYGVLIKITGKKGVIPNTYEAAESALLDD